jgi:hypothetical protein
MLMFGMSLAGWRAGWLAFLRINGRTIQFLVAVVVTIGSRRWRKF